VENFTTLGTLDLKKSYHHSGPTPNKLWTSPDDRAARAQALGCQLDLVVVCPFEQEEEWVDIASDVVKLKGENPDFPGYLKVDRLKSLGCRQFSIAGASPLARS